MKTDEPSARGRVRGVREAVSRLLAPLKARLDTSPLRARLARGMFWSAIGAVVSRGFALVASIVTARLIGRELFGALGLIQSTLSMFATFAQFGLGLTAIKHVAEFRKTDPARAGRIINLSRVMAWCTGSVTALVMVIAAPAIARTAGAPQFSPLFAFSALALLLLVVNEAQAGVLNGFEAFRRISKIQTIAGVLCFPLTVTAVWFWGLKGAVCSLVLSPLLLMGLNHFGIRREAALAGVPMTLRGLRKEMGVLWNFSVPTLLCGAVYVPVMWVANLMIVNTQNGYAEMGIFSAADRWRTAITFLPALLAGVTLPMLSNLRAEATHGEYAHMLWSNVKLSCLSAAAAAVPIAAASPWIMAAYGRGFSQGMWVLVILCASSVAASTYWIVGQSLVSRSRVWTMFGLNVLWASLFLSSVWCLRHLGARGLALSYIIADSLRLVTALLLVTGRLDFLRGTP